MKTVILAGGLGSRLAEETHKIPKPMVKINGEPILLHIMRLYSYHSLKRFVICTGYKNRVVSRYFISKFSCEILLKKKNYLKIFIKKFNWTIEFVNSGINCNTGGRLLKAKKYLLDEKNFCLTYGDGLSNINIKKLILFHKKKNKLATLTAVSPPARYGMVKIHKNGLAKFKEKIDNKNVTINGGFFVFNKKIFNILNKYSDSLEKNVLEKISASNKLNAFKHIGFWKAMDTLRDKIVLSEYLKRKKNSWYKQNK